MSRRVVVLLAAAAVVFSGLLVAGGEESAQAASARKATAVRGFELSDRLTSGTATKTKIKVTGPKQRVVKLQHRTPKNQWKVVNQARTSKSRQVLVRVRVTQADGKWVWEARIAGKKWATMARTTKANHDFRIKVPKAGKYKKKTSGFERVRAVTPTPPPAPSDPMSPVEVIRGSVASGGAQSTRHSSTPSVSADGRYVTYISGSPNLVPGDTNDTVDVFVHDQQAGETSRVSVASDGTEADDAAWAPKVSADGRLVTFFSSASNLVDGDTNATSDVFVHDRTSGETTRVSVATDGTQADQGAFTPTMSADGDSVVFASRASNLVDGDTNATTDVFVHDRTSGETTRVSVRSNGGQANGLSYEPAVSADGRYVTFTSTASNLVPGDTNGKDDVFVHDRDSGETTRVSVASAGSQANGPSEEPAVSADGRYVTFTSSASNLVPGDTNNTSDVFVHDRDTGETTRVSTDSDGEQANGRGYESVVSTDGRYVTFTSSASNLVPGDTNRKDDVFVHDRDSGETARVSVKSDGTQANDDSVLPATSADARFLAFTSGASNLVPGDSNGHLDVFVARMW